MNRPSHYLLLCVLVFAGIFVFSGKFTPLPAAKEPKKVERVVAPEGRPRTVATEAVEGLVLDSLGFRVVGAEVAVTGRDARTRTDGDGRFGLELDRGARLDVTVTANGFRRAKRAVHPGVGDCVVFSLEPVAPWDDVADAPSPPGQDFAGEGFVRTGNGVPVSGAVVTVVETGAKARTDDIGRYRIGLPTEGNAVLLVHYLEIADGTGLCARTELTEFDRRRGLIPLPDLTVERGATVRGTLRGPKGEPLVGVPLFLRGNGLHRCVLSGSDGVFGFAGLLAGNYEVLAHAWRGAVAAAARINVAAPLVQCEVRLQHTESRRFQVVDEGGKPVAGALVAASFIGERRSMAQADSEGRVEVATAKELRTDFEVRRAGDHRELTVRSVGDDGVLVVAAP